MRIKTIKNRLLVTLFGTVLLMQLGHPPTALAASTNISLSPTTQTVTKGNTFTVAVNISTTVDITAVDVNISYPSKQVVFQDVSYSGSAFGTQEAWAGGGGSIHIGRSSTSAVTGNLPLAVLTFKVIADYGSGTLSVLNTSTLENAGTPVSTTCGSATVDFGATAPESTQPKPDTTYTVLATPSKGNYDITPPVISNVQSKQTDANTVVVSWTTNEPSTSQVEYGLDGTYGLSGSDDAMVTEHKLTLHSAFLLPNSLFHYRVSSTDKEKNTVQGTDFVFTTKSVHYVLTVLGSDGKPIPGAKVTLNDQTVRSERNGKAILNSNAGEQALTVSYRDASFTKTVVIAPNKMEQTDSVAIAAQYTLIDGRYIVYPVLVIIGLVAGLAARASLLKSPLIILRRGKKRLLTMPISTVQREYGDKNPAHNPYQLRHIFSFWAVWNLFANISQRPGKKISKRIREELRETGSTEKPESLDKE